jgi:hypothetical protein
MRMGTRLRKWHRTIGESSWLRLLGFIGRTLAMLALLSVLFVVVFIAMLAEEWELRRSAGARPHRKERGAE